MDRYPVEPLPSNVAELAKHVVGHRIISAEKGRINHGPGNVLEGLVLTLSNGLRVVLCDTGECCAYTNLEAFLLHPECVEHEITGVGTTEGYTKWHIFADWGDILKLEVGWSAGTGHYGYGFDIAVVPLEVE
jgi:hypothetical protein